MTRSAVKGSPVSPMFGGSMSRVGQAGGCRAQRSQADGDGRRVGHGAFDLRVNH